MTLRVHEPLVSALERRSQALSDLQTRAQRIRDSEAFMLQHLHEEARALVDQLVSAIIPAGGTSRSIAAQNLGIPPRDEVIQSLVAAEARATNVARAHGCDLAGVSIALSEVATELESIRVHGRELARSVDLLSNDPTFRRLCAANFNDDDGVFAFWRFSSYRLRREADLVMKRFGEGRDAHSFSHLKEIHAENRAAMRTLEGAIGSLQRKHSGLQEIEVTSAKSLEYRSNPQRAIDESWRKAVADVIAEKTPRDIYRALKDVKDDATATEDIGIALQAKRALAAKSKAHYLKRCLEHFVDRVIGDVAAALHDANMTLETILAGQQPRVQWPATTRIDVDTGEIWAHQSSELDLFERIRDALVSFVEIDTLDATRPYWDQIIDFDPGNFLDELIMQRALESAPRVRSRVSTWDNAADAAAKRLADALAETNVEPGDKNAGAEHHATTLDDKDDG